LRLARGRRDQNNRLFDKTLPTASPGTLSAPGGRRNGHPPQSRKIEVRGLSRAVKAFWDQLETQVDFEAPTTSKGSERFSTIQ